jgi:hypothetical protein
MKSPRKVAIQHKRRVNARPPARSDQSTKTSWVGRVPEIKPGKYADGLPFHQLGYLCCKLTLKPNRFTSRESLFDFGEVMKAPAAECGVDFTAKGFREKPLKIREVLFLDTTDFRLYNNAFILRRRIPYQDGFPIGDPEIVFKFRHTDIQKAAEIDVRPSILGDHRLKFKCQALARKDKLGGVRLLYSHNVQFPRSALGIISDDMRNMDFMVKIFPALARLKKDPEEKVELVSNTIVEEVLQDIGRLDFGKGVEAKVDVAIWRTRGEHRPLIGEFAFQIKFKDRKEVAREALQRFESFFIALQYAAKDYIDLRATKTGTVYRLLGNKMESHE